MLSPHVPQAKIGNAEQRVGTRLLRVEDGAGVGQRLLEAWTPAGLHLTVAVDRGFDPYSLTVAGQPVNWVSPAGLRAPGLHDARQWEWLRSFQGGLLVTCGLEHVLAPLDRSAPEYAAPVPDHRHMPLHGRVSGIPAEVVAREIVQGTDGPFLSLRGRVLQAALFNERLLLEREIRLPFDRAVVEIRDRVTNVGFTPTHHEILYHLNLGYPLIDEGTVVTPVSGAPLVVTAPQPGFHERVPRFAAPEGTEARAVIANPHTGRRLELCYDVAALPEFFVWYMMAEGVYAIGLEPSSIAPADRDLAALSMLAPGQSVAYRLQISVQDTPA